MRGSATRSYGVEVANLAGLPDQIIARAKEIIKDLENNKIAQTETSQLDSEIVNILKELDINKMSPIVAFDTLNHLIEIVKK